MIPDNVTLIVKAPNQQIEDQSIECQSSWTVKQLKGHLSEVYPSKPSTDEQKIIYSGQLLEDNAILKNILRTYESSIVHTMHLVCTPKNKMQDSNTNEGLRRRNITNPTNTEQPIQRPVENRPETRQNDQNHTVEMQNYLSSFVNNYGRVPPYPVNYNMGSGYLPMTNDPAVIANHMMMMQQAYLQYMQQYGNLWQPPNTPIPPTTPEAPPAPAAPPAPPAEDDEGVARDWLDHLYAASRLAVLFSLIYVYGSPARLLLVLLLCAAGYLHQIGYFRDLQINPQEAVQPAANNANANPNGNANNPIGNANNPVGNINNPIANANNPIGNANNPIGNANNPIGNGNNPIGNANNPIGNGNNPIDNANNPNVDVNDRNLNANVNATPNVTPAAAVNANNDNQSLLAVTWMIFTSFFASLIPETN